MTKINLLLLSLVILGCHASTQAQPKLDAYVKNYSPLTPNSASLGKYGDVPVSLYTGVPNIEVPLYEIDVKGFKLPIGLSYHASGIKVEEIASWVGLGWSLNAGGVINRSQRGINDETMLHRLDQTHRDKINAILTNPSSTAANGYYLDFHQEKFDTESDIYSYNFAGHSGKFFSDLDGKFYTMPANKLKFVGDAEIPYSVLDRYFYGRWTVKDNEGVSYVFGKSSTDVTDSTATVEIVENLEQDDHDPVGGGNTNYNGGQLDRSINSWYLREIILASGEKIEFSYEAYSYAITNKITETYHDYSPLGTDLTQSATRYRKALRLKEILFPNGKVVFTKSALRRKDLLAEYPLEKIEIFEKTGTNQYSLLKYFKFKTNNPEETVSTEDTGFRLELKSVTEYDKNNVPKPPYVFEYLGSLPDRASNAQDLWGYYNGATQNTTLVPVYTEGTSVSPSGHGGLRHVNPVTVKNGTLIKMTYPTGGYTTFDYENHKAVVISQAARSMLTTVLKGNPTGMSAYARIVGTAEAFSPPFTIANPNTTLTSLTVDYSFWTPGLEEQYTQQLELNEFIDIVLQKKDGNGNFNDFETNFPNRADGLTFDIGNGTYRIRIAWTDPSKVENADIALFGLNWTVIQDQTVGPNTVVDVGGLRIKEVKHFNGIDNKVKKTTYSYLMGSESSGLIRNVPVFFYKMNEAQVINGVLHQYGMILNRTMVSQSPLLTSQGGIVGYQKVTVSEEEEGGTGINGSAVHLFTSALDYPDQGVDESFSYPFPPSINYDWMLGLSKETSYYKLDGVGPKPVKKDVFSYTNFMNPGLPDFKVNKNIKIYVGSYLYGTGPNISPEPILIRAGYVYNLPNGMPFLQNKITTEYDASGNVTLTQTINYTLSNKALQNATESAVDSKGETWTTYYTYASDLYSATASGTDALIIKGLVDNHNKKNDLIEKYTVKTDTSNSKFVVSGTLYKYDPTVPLPSEVRTLELISPLALSSFTPAVLNGSQQLQMDTRYKPLANYAYDAATYNIIRQARANGPNSGMLWGYNNSFPIATAVNAANNEIFYQDFEQGGFTAGTAHTGKYYGPDNYSVSYTRPSTTRAYSISYWYLDVSTWKFSGELDYTGPTMPLPLGTAVDDIRISPKDALMTTYTYDLLTGVTSVTDAKGLTQYYNYDSYGRLSVIKNSLGEIVKKYDYHYQGQPLN